MTDQDANAQQESPLDSLMEAVYFEFSNVADYVWKTPRFLEAEVKREVKKLTEYYPPGSDAAKIRWALEKQKLGGLFPFLMAQANFFAVTSYFEARILLLASEIEKHANIDLGTTQGTGIRPLLRSLNKIGVTYSEPPLWEQVDAALKLRNCLVHTSGIITWSRQDAELRRIVSSAIFLTQEHRERRLAQDGDIDEVRVVSSPFGDRVVIINKYAYIATIYYRDYFLALCRLATESMSGAIRDADSGEQT